MQKKFLFIFDKHKREKETSTFRGGKARKFVKLNMFNPKRKRVVHREGLFKRDYEKNTGRKKKLEMNLFNPKMR